MQAVCDTSISCATRRVLYDAICRICTSLFDTDKISWKYGIQVCVELRREYPQNKTWVERVLKTVKRRKRSHSRLSSVPDAETTKNTHLDDTLYDSGNLCRTGRLYDLYEAGHSHYSVPLYRTVHSHGIVRAVNYPCAIRYICTGHMLLWYSPTCKTLARDGARTCICIERCICNA